MERTHIFWHTRRHGRKRQRLRPPPVRRAEAAAADRKPRRLIRTRSRFSRGTRTPSILRALSIPRIGVVDAAAQAPWQEPSGLGNDVAISTNRESDALLALVKGQWVMLRVPTATPRGETAGRFGKISRPWRARGPYLPGAPVPSLSRRLYAGRPAACLSRG